ncbi:kinase-like protein [Hypoxylon sp. FL1150]|nr:kinase-like protein [Hypoxylon sp. FL1150]
MSNSGGTLTLPSPTHPHHHHVDMQAGLRSLRRSLSRSPSKFLVRTTSQSSSEAGSSPSSPSLRRVQSQYFGQNNSLNTPNGNQPHTQSPLATPFRPNVKLSLRSAKATKSPASSNLNKPHSRHRTSPRTSPRSPSRRALSQASTSGNSVPSSTSSSGDLASSGQENTHLLRTRSPATRKASEKATTRHSMHLDMSGSSQIATTRLHELNTGAVSVVSPLKRSDAIMSLDQQLSGSPNPKRRSYGPMNLDSDFNIFNHGPISPTMLLDDTSREYDWTSSCTTNTPEPLATMTSSPAMRRAGSLRKSTLQQRERSWGKRHAAQQFSQNSGEAGTPRQRERTSWGKRQAAQHLATLANNETATPNAKNRPRLSLDHFNPPQPRESPFNAQGPLPNPSMHMVNQQSHQPHPLSRAMTTSSNSTLADESPTLPTPFVEKPRAPINFSKSLPIGAVRPQPNLDQATGSISTPDYKSAKPFEGAFASTGLVSKKYHNPELGNSTSSWAVPDTPCKKPPGTFATFPQPWSGNAKQRSRHVRHAFGITTTPFDPSTPNRSSTLFTEQPRPIFFSGLSKHSRKGSLLSLYSDDGRSPSRKIGDGESSNDGDLPPTPTKQLPLSQASSRKSKLSNESPTTDRFLPASISAVGDETALQQESAVTSSPLERLGFAGNGSPQTPSGGIMPPDASGLSISNPTDGLLFPPGTDSPKPAFPPATPSTRHGNGSLLFERRAITPINGISQELDGALVTRFGRVEPIGKGEYSMVYKVTEVGEAAVQAHQSFFSTPTNRTPSPVGKVYAVKKLTSPIIGRRDRALRLREVCVLEKLRGCDHIVQLIKDWEENDCLYIQTEFCEEGSLDRFLNYVGVRGRLDDFRIWKIMLEISKGIRHIHSAGFIHLDLKPANIFIDQQGTLKIGDFGLSTRSPVEKGPDLEGDREYLAPEALRSDIGQPADIFALGLIIMEIAANVKLPENGATWSALREGDFSDIPMLTQDATLVTRDANGMPLDDTDRSVNIFGEKPPSRYKFQRAARQSGDIFGSSRKSELQEPPDFMKDPAHPYSLDAVVKWMLSPEPECRPSVYQILGFEVLNWVSSRRRAAATVFEGNWGPADEVMQPISLDVQMTDV